MWRSNRVVALFGISFVTLACYGPSTEPKRLPMDTEPSFNAVVTQITHDTAFAPAGFQLDQYELFVARGPATTANAGLILGPHATAFRSINGSLRSVPRATIVVGDTLSVWADTMRATYNSVQAPDGAPAYITDQIVIHR